MDLNHGPLRLDGLYLGNYRMMLSIGGAPSDGINTAGNPVLYLIY